MNDQKTSRSRLQSALNLLKYDQDAKAETLLKEDFAAIPDNAHTKLMQYAAYDSYSSRP